MSSQPTATCVRTTRTFDWVMVLCGFWLSFGAHLDAWAHHHVPQLETFFTPWHAVLYSGFIANAAVLGTVWWRSKARLRTWRRGVPRGYELSLLGCLVFGAGGILDMCWHLVFGIERDFAALLSPTHLILMTGAGMIVSGPLQASWQSGLPRSRLPALLSAALLLSVLSFFLQFDLPYTSQLASAQTPAWLQTDGAEELGVAGIILQSAAMTSVALVLVRRLRLPFGSFGLILGIDATLATVIFKLDPVILVGLLGGLVADALYRVIRPASSPARFRLFAFLFPVPLYSLYFAGIEAVDGIWWQVHVWVGSVIAAALTGWLLSFLVWPGANTHEKEG